MEKELKIEYKADYKIYKKKYFHYYIYQANVIRLALYSFIIFFLVVLLVISQIRTHHLDFYGAIPLLIPTGLLVVILVLIFILMPLSFQHSMKKTRLTHKGRILTDGHITSITFDCNGIHVFHDILLSEYSYENILGYFFSFTTACLCIGNVYNFLSSEMTRIIIFPVTSRDELSAFLSEKGIKQMSGAEFHTHYANTTKLALKKYKEEKKRLE